LTADAVARFDTTDHRDTGVRLLELDRATMPLHRLAIKIDAWTRWAEHRTHEGPRHLNGTSRAVWREHYPGHECPPLWMVTTGADPGLLRRRIDRLRPAQDGDFGRVAVLLAGARFLRRCALGISKRCVL
jgi:hypothetical protein